MSHQYLNNQFGIIISAINAFFTNKHIYVCEGRSWIGEREGDGRGDGEREGYEYITAEIWVSKTDKDPERKDKSKLFYVSLNSKGNCEIVETGTFKENDVYAGVKLSNIYAEIELNKKLIIQTLEPFLVYLYTLN